ncbi:MAG: hypothetical protein DBX41_06215 [Clostridiales bacterium]|nr:MAG: hypothetical protein DBX41_06215 [Clostridiales bacterium]
MEKYINLWLIFQHFFTNFSFTCINAKKQRRDWQTRLCFFGLCRGKVYEIEFESLKKCIFLPIFFVKTLAKRIIFWYTFYIM